jgi:tetratricopeptide (TPR) repeat protein
LPKHAGESRPAERGRRGRAAAVALGAALLLGWPGLVRAQSSDTLYQEALEARRKGDFAAAIRLLQEALRLEPKNADALLLLGTVYGFQNRFGEAEATLREALALAPDYADAKLALARVLAWQKRYGEATALTDEVVAKGPPRPDAYELAGRIAYYRGDLDLAGERFRRALDIQPTTLDALVGLGDVAEARGDSREARRWWSRPRPRPPTRRTCSAGSRARSSRGGFPGASTSPAPTARSSGPTWATGGRATASSPGCPRPARASTAASR